jgi:hypothetical protein
VAGTDDILSQNAGDYLDYQRSMQFCLESKSRDATQTATLEGNEKKTDVNWNPA